MQQPTYAPLQPRIVLGVAAHPDDLDYAAGGTMAAFANAGAKVYYLVLTDGAKGSSDRTMTSKRLRDMRRDEQRAAGKVLGLADIFFLDYPDGMLQNTIEVKQSIVKVIRQIKPDTLVTIDPSVVYSAEYKLINHPDHRAAGQAALDAVYPLARDHMTFPELLEQGLEPHNTGRVLLFSFDLDPKRANFAVDISDTLKQKLQAIGAHSSQFGEYAAVERTLRTMALGAGQQFGYDYAEPFVRIDVD